MDSILFIGCLYTEGSKEIYQKLSRRGYQFAAQTFQEALLDGITKNGCTVTVLTVPPLGTFPLSYKSPFIKNEAFVYEGKEMGLSLGYLNIPFFNAPSQKEIHNFLNSWYNNQSGSIKTVIVYGLHVPLMKAAVYLKKKYCDIKLCSIIPDLPEYMACNKYYKALGLKERDNRLVDRFIGYFDSYVLLSKYMSEKLDIGEKPYTVVEGIFSNPMVERVCDRRKKTILYTGALSARYGLIDLVQAFMKIPDKEYELWLCGSGDAVNTINDYSKIDNRIKYLGKKNHDEVLSLQRMASLLVNPRHSNEVFTRYSFPSKTMEYLYSETPVVMCPLQCIPEEYKKYLFFFEDETIEGFRDKMMEVCEMDSEELMERGRKARGFILSEKNATKQVKKIIDLVLNENSNS